MIRYGSEDHGSIIRQICESVGAIVTHYRKGWTFGILPPRLSNMTKSMNNLLARDWIP